LTRNHPGVIIDSQIVARKGNSETYAPPPVLKNRFMPEPSLYLLKKEKNGIRSNCPIHAGAGCLQKGWSLYDEGDF